jgi:hypothetical protein
MIHGGEWSRGVGHGHSELLSSGEPMMAGSSSPGRGPLPPRPTPPLSSTTLGTGKTDPKIELTRFDGGAAPGVTAPAMAGGPRASTSSTRVPCRSARTTPRSSRARTHSMEYCTSGYW